MIQDQILSEPLRCVVLEQNGLRERAEFFAQSVPQLHHHHGIHSALLERALRVDGGGARFDDDREPLLHELLRELFQVVSDLLRPYNRRRGGSGSWLRRVDLPNRTVSLQDTSNLFRIPRGNEHLGQFATQSAFEGGDALLVSQGHHPGELKYRGLFVRKRHSTRGPQRPVYGQWLSGTAPCSPERLTTERIAFHESVAHGIGSCSGISQKGGNRGEGCEKREWLMLRETVEIDDAVHLRCQQTLERPTIQLLDR